jgi:hypothetical protein
MEPRYFKHIASGNIATLPVGGKNAWIGRSNTSIPDWAVLAADCKDWKEVFPLFKTKDGIIIFKEEDVVKCYLLMVDGSISPIYNKAWRYHYCKTDPSIVDVFWNKGLAEKHYAENIKRYSLAEIKHSAIGVLTSRSLNYLEESLKNLK